MNTAIWPACFGAAAIAASILLMAGFAGSGRRASSFFASAGPGPVSVAALTASPGLPSGFSLDLATSGLEESALTSLVLASRVFSSAVTLAVAGASVLTASLAGCAATSSGLVPAAPVAPASVGLISAVAASGGLVSSALASDVAVSPGFSVAGSASDFATSDVVASAFASIFDASLVLVEAACAPVGGVPSVRAAGSSREAALPPDDAASLIVTGALVAGMSALASAVWVCSRKDAEADGSPIAGFAPSA